MLAVPAGVPGRAGAGVAALSGVQAGGAVHARGVVGAVVEVLVAKEAAPSGVALAGVGLGAGAVLAARVADALVAVDASPSRPTPIEKKNRGLCEKMNPQATTFD